MVVLVWFFFVIGLFNFQEFYVDLLKCLEIFFYKIEINFLMIFNGDGDGEGVLMFDFVDDEGFLFLIEYLRYLFGSYFSQFYGLKIYQIYLWVLYWRCYIEVQVKFVNGEYFIMKIVEIIEKWLCLYEELYKVMI